MEEKEIKTPPTTDFYSLAVFHAYSNATQICVAGHIDPSKVESYAVDMLNNMWINLDLGRKNNNR